MRQGDGKQPRPVGIAEHFDEHNYRELLQAARRGVEKTTEKKNPDYKSSLSEAAASLNSATKN